MSIISHQVKDFTFTSNSKLCSLHFHRNSMTSDRELKDGSVPKFFRLNVNNSEASVRRCCIMGCNSTSNTIDAKHFYQFPGNGKLCDEWVNAIRTKNFQNIIPAGNKFICNLHFPIGTSPDAIMKSVPTIFFRKRFLNGDIIQRNEEQTAKSVTNARIENNENVRKAKEPVLM